MTSMREYSAMRDEELIILIHQGDDDAQNELFARYKNYVRARARSYFLVGADKEDVIQEGMIGLYKAMRDFRADKQSVFRAFAELCITRQMITAIKCANRQKHIPLNSYISLNKPVYDEDSDRQLIDVLTIGKTDNPEELLIGREDYKNIEKQIYEQLSKFEWTVLANYVSGKSYLQIAQTMKKPTKSIDNALQRIKRKLEKCLDERNKEF